jgi:membrane protein DedA with SNARE-associated domain
MFEGLAMAAYAPHTLFLAGLIEELVVFIPSSAVFLGAGFAASAQGIPFDRLFQSLGVASFAAGFGMTLGSLVAYALAYWGGKPAVERWGRYIGVSWRDIARAEARWSKGVRDEIAIIIARAVPFFPVSPVSVLCGLLRIPLGSFFIATIAGAAIRVSLLIVCGWYVGREYALYAAALESVSTALTACIAFAAIVAVVIWRRRAIRRAAAARSGCQTDYPGSL